ncbi:MAG: hypothetical protein PUJ82_12260 [Spirochaetales bacterium]|nr:hypothetical protein [Spirochaetales bacterium]MDY5916182.1 hypothetical protein [Treponema sp.]
MSIEKLIEKSLKDLVKALRADGICNKLIFPHYRNGNVRYSEQELKQIFLKNVEEDETYFYSVETPTKLVYSFLNLEKPETKATNTSGDHHRSGCCDVTLYSENKIESLASCIEFKHGNSKSICKDFLKLAKEVKLTNEKKSFFVHYLNIGEKNAWESKKFQKLFENYRNSIDEIENKIEDKDDLSKVQVYLVCIHGKEKIASTYHFSLSDLKNYTVGTKYSDLKEKDWLNEEIFNSGEKI